MYLQAGGVGHVANPAGGRPVLGLEAGLHGVHRVGRHGGQCPSRRAGHGGGEGVKIRGRGGPDRSLHPATQMPRRERNRHLERGAAGVVQVAALDADALGQVVAKRTSETTASEGATRHHPVLPHPLRNRSPSPPRGQLPRDDSPRGAGLGHPAVHPYQGCGHARPRLAPQACSPQKAPRKLYPGAQNLPTRFLE